MMKIRLLLLIMIFIPFVVRGQTIQEFASCFQNRVNYPSSVLGIYNESHKKNIKIPDKIALKFIFDNDVKKMKYKYSGDWNADEEKLIGAGEMYDKKISPILRVPNINLVCFTIDDCEKNCKTTGECYLYSRSMQLEDKLMVALQYESNGTTDTYFLNDSTLVRVGDIDINGTPIDKKWASVRLEKIKINKRRLKFEIQQQLIIKANTNNILDSIPSYCKKLGLEYPLSHKH